MGEKYENNKDIYKALIFYGEKIELRSYNRNKNTGEQVKDEKGFMRRLGLSVIKTSNHNSQNYIRELYKILEENNIVNITENINLVKFEREEFMVNDYKISNLTSCLISLVKKEIRGI